MKRRQPRSRHVVLPLSALGMPRAERFIKAAEVDVGIRKPHVVWSPAGRGYWQAVLYDSAGHEIYSLLVPWASNPPTPSDTKRVLQVFGEISGPKPRRRGHGRC